MKVKYLRTKGTWREITDSARTTQGLKEGEGEPSSLWKKRILLAEHSPIRKLIVDWKWYDLKYWVSVHFVRHKFGIEHWIKSQRPDRGLTDNRNNSPQSALVNHECEANAQAIINISRKRLCMKASPETRLAWTEFLYKLSEFELELYSACVPDCIYRGHCYEMNSCGFYKTLPFQNWLKEYREGINDM